MINKILKLINKHPLKSFITILFLSLLISRYLGLYSNFHPSVSEYRFHHFYYGLILLAITSVLFIFTRVKKEIINIATAISLGMIIDEIILIFTLDQAPYNWQSFPETLFISIIVCLLTIIISKT